MSSVNELASSFVEMAKAYERLPTLEIELAEARNFISDQSDTIQRLELKLITRSNEISDLHATIRALEVSRDDAELRFLECDDAKSTLVRVLQGLIGDAKGVLAAIEPMPPVSSTPETATPSPVTDTPAADSTMEMNFAEPTPEDREPSIPSPVETATMADTPTTELFGGTADNTAELPVPTHTDAPSDPVSVPTPFSDASPTSSPSTPETSAPYTATPSTDVSSDPEPMKYLTPAQYPWSNEINPAWIDWHNRHPVAAQ